MNVLNLSFPTKSSLKKTGGILQGMSGSPIIQNGRFVGAVTHMFVEEPKKGSCYYCSGNVKKVILIVGLPLGSSIFS